MRLRRGVTRVGAPPVLPTRRRDLHETQAAIHFLRGEIGCVDAVRMQSRGGRRERHEDQRHTNRRRKAHVRDGSQTRYLCNGWNSAATPGTRRTTQFGFGLAAMTIP
jgi:hypothetical protein